MKTFYGLIPAFLSLVMAGITGGLFVTGNVHRPPTRPAPRYDVPLPTAIATPPLVPGQSVSLSGKIICLTKVDTGEPQTLECGLGLLTAEGDEYALYDPFQIAMYASGKSVVVSGTILKSAPGSSYDVVGILNVEGLVVSPSGVTN